MALTEMLEAAGMTHTHQLNRRHIVRRLSASQIKLADQIYPRVEINALIKGDPVEDPRLAVYWHRVTGDSFGRSTMTAWYRDLSPACCCRAEQ